MINDLKIDSSFSKIFSIFAPRSIEYKTAENIYEKENSIYYQPLIWNWNEKRTTIHDAE